MHGSAVVQTRSAARHGMSAERTNHLIEKLTLYFPRFIHLQPITKQGWLEVETKTNWDPRWFVVRDTSICIYESNTTSEPTSVFPCAACEVLNPKNARKDKQIENLFRINIESYAVGAQSASSGTKSKNVALKYIVNATSGASPPASSASACLYGCVSI